MSYSTALLAAAVAFSMSSQAAPLRYGFVGYDEIDSDDRYPSRYHGQFYHLAPDDDIREPEVFRYFRRLEDFNQDPSASPPIDDQRKSNIKTYGVGQTAVMHITRGAAKVKKMGSAGMTNINRTGRIASEKISGGMSTAGSSYRRYFRPTSDEYIKRKSDQRANMISRINDPIGAP